MYLHLGASVVIPLGDVLGIFDLDNTTSSRVTRDFLARAQQAGQVVSVGEDLPKSFLLCRNQAGRVSLLQPSSATCSGGWSPAALRQYSAASPFGEQNFAGRGIPSGGIKNGSVGTEKHHRGGT
ncbi:MAG: extracellular matrix regulator RemB [Evtepia gabavorous]